MSVKLTSILIIVVLVALFVIQNVAIVEIQFMFWSIQMSRSILMFLLLAVGMMLGWILKSHFHGRK